MSQSQLKTLYAPRLAKFVLMNLTTLGFYNIYWGYRNWSTMRESGRTSAPAPICGLFLPLTLFSLVEKVRAERIALGTSGAALMVAQVGFLFLNFLKALPIIGILFLLIAFIALIPINRLFVRINIMNQNVKTEIYSFTKVNIIWIIGVIAWIAINAIQKRMGT